MYVKIFLFKYNLFQQVVYPSAIFTSENYIKIFFIR